MSQPLNRKEIGVQYSSHSTSSTSMTPSGARLVFERTRTRLVDNSSAVMERYRQTMFNHSMLRSVTGVR
jgi:hypothetical protein